MKSCVPADGISTGKQVTERLNIGMNIGVNSV